MRRKSRCSWWRRQPARPARSCRWSARTAGTDTTAPYPLDGYSSLAARGIDTRGDLHTWLDHQRNRVALRTVKGVGPKTADCIGHLVGRSQVAVDGHLRAFAADAGLPDLGHEQLQAVYEAAATLLGHDRAGSEHAVWRFMPRAT